MTDGFCAAVPAIYEQGRIRPLQAVKLKERAQILIRIEKNPVDTMAGLVHVDQKESEELIEEDYEDFR